MPKRGDVSAMIKFALYLTDGVLTNDKKNFNLI